jgi:hypothetical protein
MLEMDWARTARGPIAQWPHSLKTAATLVLNSPVPIVMLWGPDGAIDSRTKQGFGFGSV